MVKLGARAMDSAMLLSGSLPISSAEIVSADQIRLALFRDGVLQGAAVAGDDHLVDALIAAPHILRLYLRDSSSSPRAMRRQPFCSFVHPPCHTAQHWTLVVVLAS